MKLLSNIYDNITSVMFLIVFRAVKIHTGRKHGPTYLSIGYGRCQLKIPSGKGNQNIHNIVSCWVLHSCDTTLFIFLFYAFHTQDMLAEIPFQVTEYMKDRNFTPNVPDVSMATKFQDMTLGFWIFTISIFFSFRFKRARTIIYISGSTSFHFSSTIYQSYMH